MRKDSKICGIIPPIITPMNMDESINFTELKKQVRRMVKAGVHGIFPFGTNGEAYALNNEEKIEILKVVVKEVNGAVPVYAGTGCITTKDTIKLSAEAKKAGADILSVVTPYFAAVSQTELYDHYKAVAEAVDLPIVLYNIPMRTGCNIEPETVSALADIPNIVGVKDSSGKWDNLAAYIEMTKEKDFVVLSGNDGLILRALQAGAVGAIAGCANVYPENMVAIYENYTKGNMEEAQKAQNAIATFRECFKYGNPNTITKLSVELLGYPVGKCRRPFCSIPEEGILALKQVLKINSEKGMT